MDASGSDDVRFVNNVSIGRPGRGNGFDVWNSTNIEKSHNIFYPVARDESGRGGYTEIANPGFVNPGHDPNTADFRPAGGSPLIGGGIDRYEDILFPNVDMSGKPRPPGAPSIGAFEP